MNKESYDNKLLIRRETVWILSSEGKKVKGGSLSSTKGSIRYVSIVYLLLLILKYTAP